MQEDKQAQPTEEFHGTDVSPETPVAETKPAGKPRFKIDLFQTARIHTEQFVQEFEDEAEARQYIEDLCKEKGIEADYEIEVVPEVAEPVENESETESEISPEGSGEKTTQENGLPLN